MKIRITEEDGKNESSGGYDFIAGSKGLENLVLESQASGGIYLTYIEVWLEMETENGGLKVGEALEGEGETKVRTHFSWIRY